MCLLLPICHAAAADNNDGGGDNGESFFIQI
jgi:hypothetical protein